MRALRCRERATIQQKEYRHDQTWSRLERNQGRSEGRLRRDPGLPRSGPDLPDPRRPLTCWMGRVADGSSHPKPRIAPDDLTGRLMAGNKIEERVHDHPWPGLVDNEGPPERRLLRNARLFDGGFILPVPAELPALALTSSHEAGTTPALGPATHGRPAAPAKFHHRGSTTASLRLRFL